MLVSADKEPKKKRDKAASLAEPRETQHLVVAENRGLVCRSRRQEIGADGLTKRQRDIAEAFANGTTDTEELAQQFGCSFETVRELKKMPEFMAAVKSFDGVVWLRAYVEARSTLIQHLGSDNKWLSKSAAQDLLNTALRLSENESKSAAPEIVFQFAPQPGMPPTDNYETIETDSVEIPSYMVDEDEFNARNGD